jgi:effector-binding domain-containing protein
MKLLKYLFFLILIVVIGSAIYFGTQDGHYAVAESKIMNAPASLIFTNVNDFKNWQTWGPWMAKDPDIKITYAEKTSGEGGSYSWTSDDMEVGDGSMTTIKVIPNKEIGQTITFNTPIGESKSDVSWDFESTENPTETKVTWAMKGEQSLLEKVFMAFSDDDLEAGISEMFQEGLASLDSAVAKEMKVYSINADGISQYGGGYYMYNTTAAKMEEVGLKMGPLMGQVMNFMQQQNIPMAGAPFTIYNQVNELENSVIFSAAIPVKEKINTPMGSPVLNSYMAPVTAVKMTLKGDYKNLPETYSQGQQYLTQNGYELHPSAKMFEVYLTNPEEEPNPADWITEVYIPIIKPVAPAIF